MIAFVGRSSNEINELNHVLIINVPTKANIESNSAIFYYIKGFILNLICALSGAKFLKRNREYLYVNAHSNIAAIIATLSRRNINVVYTIHDVLYSTSEHPKLMELFIRLLNNFLLERIAITVSSAVVVVSPRIRDQIPKKSQHKVLLKYPKTSLVFSGGDNCLCTYADFRSESPGKFVISTGYQNERKRFDLLIDTWRLVDSEYDLMIIGNGPTHDRLENSANELGLSKRIHFLKNLTNEELAKLLKKSVAGILISSREGFPTSIIECLGAGKPAMYFTLEDLSSYRNLESEYLHISALTSISKMAKEINTFLANLKQDQKGAIIQWAEATFQLKKNYAQSLIESFGLPPK
jgi:glycosyltransferase involved in cell wall biosynthesis